MESIDLELGDLFDRDAVDVDNEGEDVGAHAEYGEDDAAADGAEGWCPWFRALALAAALHGPKISSAARPGPVHYRKNTGLALPSD